MLLATARRVPTQYFVVGVLFCIVLLVSVLHTKTRSSKPLTDLLSGTGPVYLRYDTSSYINSEGRIIVPSDKVLYSMTLPELEELFFRYQETIEVVCARQRHIGDELDGGYHICETIMPKKSCLAYSFGNRKDYTFDDGVAAYYNCEVHAFDPDDTQVDHQHSELVYFHKLGIGDKNEIIKDTLDIKTLDTIRVLLHHENRQLNLLKIDAEGAEWGALKQMLENKSLQRANVTTIIVEFHTVFFNRDREFYLSGLKTMRGLYEAGYRRYFYRMWHGGCIFTNKKTGLSRTGCHEVHFMKI